MTLDMIELFADRPLLGIVTLTVLLPAAAVVGDTIFGQPRNSNGEYARKRRTAVVRAYRFIAYTVAVLAIAYWVSEPTLLP